MVLFKDQLKMFWFPPFFSLTLTQVIELQSSYQNIKTAMINNQELFIIEINTLW